MNIDLLINYLLDVFSFDENSPLLFTQMHFWVFFCIVFAGFAYMQKRAQMRNAYLMAVSLLFYYKTSGLFVGLLLLVTCSDFFIAQQIYACSERWKKRLWLTLGVTLDLGILCYFKYSYFFADIIEQIFGIHFDVRNIAAEWFNAATGSPVFSVDRIILPVGISFYTFQVISYTTDVYRGLIKPVRNILDFGFYVSFFPQLVAGPIVKASDFIPQLYHRYFLSRRMFGLAIFMILGGLTKKIILSDYLALNFIDRVFANPLLFTGFENLAALFLYSLQVYADFSGYTDIAIGVAMLMGFYLPQNFNSPYKASNPQDFWRRWHMSLSNWLKNYLYIPLGGNRNASFGTYFWIILFAVIAVILSGRGSSMAPASTSCLPMATHSSPGCHTKRTLPQSSSRQEARIRAAPASMEVWTSWPQACIMPQVCEAKAAPVCSVTGRASISARKVTLGPSPLPPRRKATVSVSRNGGRTSRGRSLMYARIAF